MMDKSLDKLMLAFSIVAILFCVYATYRYLLQIERTRIEHVNPKLPKEIVDLSKIERKFRRFARKVEDKSEPSKGLQLVIAIVISLVAYFSLVALFETRFWWIGLMTFPIISMIVTMKHIETEVSPLSGENKARYDRLASIATLLLLIAAFSSMGTYASKSMQENGRGSTYKGYARVTDYDTTNYDNDMYGGDEGAVPIRLDLDVEWSGCKEKKTCQSVVHGVLCEADLNNGRRYRALEEDQGEQNNENDKEEENEGQENDQENEEQNNEGEESGDDQSQDNDEQEEDEAQEEGSQEEDEEHEEGDGGGEEEDEERYSFGDDSYGSAYWNAVDWEEVWGETECGEMFNMNLGSGYYDEYSQAGYDGWPAVYISGNCNTCQAYVGDYKKSKHYKHIQYFKYRGFAYLALAIMGVAYVNWLLHKNETPLSDKEEKLLTSVDGDLTAESGTGTGTDPPAVDGYTKGSVSIVDESKKGEMA